MVGGQNGKDGEDNNLVRSNGSVRKEAIVTLLGVQIPPNHLIK